MKRPLRLNRRKEGGSASRRDKWPVVNWDNTDATIARELGVTRHAVRHQRKRAGLPPSARGRKNVVHRPILLSA